MRPARSKRCRLLGVVAAASLALVTGCGGGAGGDAIDDGEPTSSTGGPVTTRDSSAPAGTNTSEPTVDRAHLADGEPIAFPVSTEVAANGAVTAVVGSSDGGVLETTGPDGTGYRLEIPPGALLESTVITMTPLASLTGDLVDGLVGGVHLEPSGLQLGVLAQLVIAPSREVPVGVQVPFGYQGSGTEFTAAFIEPDPSRTVVWVEHFSGYGVLESTELRMEMNRRLSAAESRRGDVYRYRMSEVLVAARDQGGETVTGEALDEFEAIRQEMIRDHLRPRVEFAEQLASSGNPGDLEYISDVITEMLSIERQAQLVGTSSSIPDDLLATVGRIFSAVEAAMEERCRVEHDFTVVPILLGIARTLALLGIESDLTTSSGCGRFELRLTAELDFPDSSLWPSVVGRAEASVPVGLGGGDPGPDAHLDWTWESTEPGCPVEASQPGVASLEVVQFRFWWDNGDEDGLRSREDGRLAPPDDVMIFYDVGEGETLIEWDTCGTSGYWIGDYVSDAWSALHAEETTGTSPRWIATDWEMLFDGELVARRTYERQVDDVQACTFGDVCWPFGLTVVERTVLELVHTPG